MKPLETRVGSQGYMIFNCGARYGGPIFEHIVVAEDMFGGPLPAGLHVHHLDGVKLNNNPLNLMILSQSHHREIHRRLEAEMACGNADWRKCQYCKKYDSPKNLFRNKASNASYHKPCVNKYQLDRINNTPGARDRKKESQRLTWAKNKDKYNERRRVGAQFKEACNGNSDNLNP